MKLQLVALACCLAIGPLLDAPPPEPKTITFESLREGRLGDKYRLMMTYDPNDTRGSIAEYLCEVKYDGRYLAELDYWCLQS